MIRLSSILFIIIFLSNCATSSIKMLSKDDPTIALPAENGYLIISLKSDWRTLSFIVQGKNKLSLEKFRSYTGRNYFFAAIPAGQYQIKRLDIGHNRYFNLNNSDAPYNFSVKPKVINYGGELNVKSKGNNLSSFELINRSSFALEFLESFYPNILASLKLEYAGPGTDSFFELASDTKLKNSDGIAK